MFPIKICILPRSSINPATSDPRLFEPFLKIAPVFVSSGIRSVKRKPVLESSTNTAIDDRSSVQ